MHEYLLAILIPPILLLGWAIVQNAWRRQFDIPGGDDVLATRGGCDKCNCTKRCPRQMD